MGQRILLLCDTCGCKKEMSVGAGLLSGRPDIIASCLDPKDAETWRWLYDGKKIGSFRSEQKVYYCEHCKDLVCQLTVNARLTDGTEKILGNRCEKCHNELQEIDMEAHHMICPICGNGDLSWKQVGFWD